MRHKAVLIAALIIPAVFLTSCALSLTEQDGKLVDKKNGVTYACTYKTSKAGANTGDFESIVNSISFR